MADENNVFPDSISEPTERIKCDATNDDQRILRLHILQKLLEFLKDPSQKYTLSTVLQFIQEEYEENVFCQELLALVKEEYIEISPIDAQDDANLSDTMMVMNASIAKQLIEEGDYGKILITLKEQQSGLLLHSFVDANIAMLEMKLQFNKVEEEFEQQKDIIEQYNKKEQDISDINAEFQKKYEAVNTSLDEWDRRQKDLEERIDEAKKALTEQVESEYKKFTETLEGRQNDIEKSVASKAEEKTLGTIEEEIKSTGKIGQAMHDAQKSIIQYLAIFVAIFSLVNIDIVNAAQWSYAELFRVNVIMTTSMATLVALVHIFTDKEYKWFKPIIILLAVLWIALAVSVLGTAAV